MIARTPRRAVLAAVALAWLLMLAAPADLRAQQPPPAPPAGPPAGAPQGAPPQGGGGRGGPPKNLQILKDIPQEQLGLTMQYIAASLGVACTHCHVQGQNDLDDKEPKKIARAT